MLWAFLVVFVIVYVVFNVLALPVVSLVAPHLVRNPCELEFRRSCLGNGEEFVFIDSTAVNVGVAILAFLWAAALVRWVTTEETLS